MHYSVFTLHKLVGLSSGPKINVACRGGYAGHQFIALSCTNDTVIFRYAGDSGSAPLVRYLPWLKEPGKRIISMDFNAPAQWLMCVTADFSIVLLPIYFLMCKKSNDIDDESELQLLEDLDKRSRSTLSSKRGPLSLSLKKFSKKSLTTSSNSLPKKSVIASSPLGSFTDVTIIKPEKLKTKASPVACLWWTTKDGIDYGIIASTQSNTSSISFVNIPTQEEELVIKMKNSISKMELVKTNSYQYLLMSTNQGYWRLLLEQQIDSQKYETILEATQQSKKQDPSSPFQATQITRFPQGVSLSVQYSKQGAPLIGAYYPNSCKFELYDTELSKFALYVYQLTNGDNVHIADKFSFVSRVSEKGSVISVVSNHIASDSRRFSKLPREPIVQEFAIANQSVNGILRGFPTFASRDDEKSFNLAGCYIWTTDALYEFCPNSQPESIFYELLAQGLEKSAAEPLGKTIGLDLLRLYETAADTYFNAKEIGRALDLYYLSNVRTSKFVGKYMSISRMDIVLTHLRSALHQPTAISVADRKWLSDTLLMCYIYQLLANKDTFLAMEKEFLQLIRNNKDYNAENAILLLSRFGLVNYMLEVAHARQLVPNTIEAISGHVITTDELANLESSASFPDVKSLIDSPLFKYFDTQKQLQLLLSDPSNLMYVSKKLINLLPTLEESELVVVATLFDPVKNSFKTQRETLLKQPNKATEIPLLEDCIELFITSLLMLNGRRRTKRSSFGSTNLPPSLSPLLEMFKKKLFVVNCGWNHLGVFAEGSVYMWGKNEFGQLGINNTQDQKLPAQIDFFNRRKVTHLACGGEHSFAVVESAHLFSWGRGDKGQLGIGEKVQMKLTPTEVPVPENMKDKQITQVACGFAHTLLLTDNGEMFTCGAGDKGQLGLGNRSDQLKLCKINSSDKYIAVACGYYHSAALTDNGTMYTWGNGIHGELGHGDGQDTFQPRRVEAFESKRIKKIVCGHFHTVAVTDLDSVYCWGRGSKGRLGTGNQEDSMLPHLVDSLLGKSISSIACGRSHTAALTGKGEVYIWGSNEFGKLGLLHSSDDMLTPAIVPSLQGKRVSEIYCGDSFTVVSCEEDETWYAWGRNESGQLALGITQDQTIPTPIAILAELSKQVFEDTSVYSQESLENALRHHFGNYNTTSVLNKCIDWGNWDAASVVYELTGDWSESLECKLMSMITKSEQLNSDKSPHPSLDLNELILLITNMFSRDTSGFAKAEMLVLFFRFWDQRKLPLAPLEAWILGNIDNGLHIQKPLNSIIESNPDPLTPLILPFSTQVFLALIQASFKNSTVTEDKLWNLIKETLNKDVSKRNQFNLPSLTLHKDNLSEFDDVVIGFTCGHHFKRRGFYEVVLPEFQQRMANLIAAPVSTMLFLSEYHQKKINLACPVCTFNWVHDSMTKKTNTARSVQSWILE